MSNTMSLQHNKNDAQKNESSPEKAQQSHDARNVTSMQLEQNARRAIDDAIAVVDSIDLFDDAIPVADCDIQWPDYDSVREAFEALAERGMTHALVRFSDELMRETDMRGDEWIKSEISRCIDIARSAVIASNMNAARKNAFLHRVKQWKHGKFPRRLRRGQRL